MKEGIVFHPNSPYHAVCADVMLVNPPGVVGQHTHSIDVSSQDLDLSFFRYSSAAISERVGRIVFRPRMALALVKSLLYRRTKHTEEQIS